MMRDLLNRFSQWQDGVVDDYIMPLFLPGVVVFILAIIGLFITIRLSGNSETIQLNKDEWQCTASVEKSGIVTGTGVSSGPPVIVVIPTTTSECTQYQKRK